MVNYHIINYIDGFLINAKYKPSNQWLQMGRNGKWGSVSRDDHFDSYAEALKKMEELMSEEKPKYESRVTQVVVNKPNEPIFSETATKIEIDDEAAGEYLKISQDNRYIQITPEEWPEIKSQIDKMILQCREMKP